MVLIVVIIVVGAGAYVAFSYVTPGATSFVSCNPPTSPACKALGAHDLSVLAPFRSTQQAQLIPFSARLPVGETASSYTFNFGDGSPPVTTGSAIADHAYRNPGTYLVYVTAQVGGSTHDNARGLDLVQVAASYTADVNGNLPSVLGAITGNSTSHAAPTAVLQPGQSATFAGSYSSAPTNPAWSLQPAKIVSTGGAVGTPTTTPSSVTASVSFSTSGVDTVTFVGSAKSGGSAVFQNYTWTVFVAPNGVHGGVAGAATHTSPHPGTIIAYEDIPGGATTLDPALDYEFGGFEPILNVYQNLIAYNWSSTGPTAQTFVPELATCVPGSPQCQHLYGNTLVSSNLYNYTFVINSASQFYDPATGAHWGVYPSDVMFSLARTLAFSDYPCVGCNNGWIVSQSLLPSVTTTWDGGLHTPYNNTPFDILSSMSVNDTAAGCPQAAMTSEHGCVTFHADANGHAWPFFLELLADPLGGSIISCGWASSNAGSGGAAGLPYWTAGNSSGAGDHPCLLPGGATSTTDSRFTTAIAAIPPMAWDSYQTVGGVPPFLGRVSTSMVGSGPYYMADYRIGISYALKANPAYAQPPTCTWMNCEPKVGQYAKIIDVSWETNVNAGEQAYAAGTADFATIPTTDTALLLQLVQRGQVNALSVPQITIFFYPLVMNFSVKAAQSYTPSPVTAPGDLLSYIGMREFFVHAYPYATTQANVWTRDGIQYGFHYGGAIPQFMANYYPTNVSWPNGDPCTSDTNSNCPGYWWAQIQNPLSPYFDPEVASCTTASPCSLPMFVDTGDPAGDQVMQLWTSDLSTFSGGRIVGHGVDINFIQEIINSFSAPGTSPMPTWTIGWIPDYPDPTDYVVPFYYPDATYSYSMAMAEQLTSPAFNATAGCTPWTSIAYWVHQTAAPPSKCQGQAYAAMLWLLGRAAFLAAGPQRVLLYNMAEHIANNLALYVYSNQGNLVATAASWVDLASINPNVTLGGDTQWYAVTGTSLQFPGST